MGRVSIHAHVFRALFEITNKQNICAFQWFIEHITFRVTLIQNIILTQEVHITQTQTQTHTANHILCSAKCALSTM